MAYAATAASGAKIQVNINGTFTTIPGVEGIPEFGPEKQEIEVTPIDATGKSYIGDVPDYGELVLPTMWDPTDDVHKYCMGRAVASAATDNFKVVYGSNNASFNGEIMSFKPSFNKGSAKMANMKIKLSGVVTYA